jgi:hypothetical protein
LVRLEFTYLREVFKCCEGHYIAFAVQHGDSKESAFYQFQNSRVRVNTVINVVLANLNQVDDLVAIVGVGPAKNDAIVIEFFSGLKCFKFWIHTVVLFVCFSLLFYLYKWGIKV